MADSNQCCNWLRLWLSNIEIAISGHRRSSLMVEVDSPCTLFYLSTIVTICIVFVVFGIISILWNLTFHRLRKCSGMDRSASPCTVWLIVTLHCVSKKVPTFKLSATLWNLNRFSKFCTARKRMKFATKPMQQYPPHLRHVATLLWEI